MTTKPTLAFTTLLNALLPFAEAVPAGPARLNVPDTLHGEPAVLLLTGGHATTWRHPDNLRLSTVEAPFLFGLGATFCDTVFYSVAPHRGAVLYRVPMALMTAQIMDGNLMRAWNRATAHEMTLMFERDRALLEPDNTALVRRLLQRYAALPTDERRSLSVMRYLEQSTVLSRSTLQRVLATLPHTELEHM